jgi:hypothetical protein
MKKMSKTMSVEARMPCVMAMPRKRAVMQSKKSIAAPRTAWLARRYERGRATPGKCFESVAGWPPNIAKEKGGPNKMTERVMHFGHKDNFGEERYNKQKIDTHKHTK